MILFRMDSGNSMACWWCHRPDKGRRDRSPGKHRGRMVIFRREWPSLLVLMLLSGGVSETTAVAALTEREVTEVSKLGTARGRSSEEISRLIGEAGRAEARGLPAGPLLDKLREGLAKGIETRRLEQVLATLATHLDTARTLQQEFESRAGREPAPGERQRALEVLAEALGRGVTPDEIRAIGRGLREAGGEVRGDLLAYGAKGMALMKEGGLPGAATAALLMAAMRQGLTPTELLGLARELKGRGPELRGNLTRLQELQRAIERGERSEQLFRESRERRVPGGRLPGGTNRPERIEPQNRDRQTMERPTQPERPERLEPLERPHR